MFIYKKPQKILQDWVTYLDPVAQSNVLKMLRASDVKPSYDGSKNLIKFIRRLVLHNNYGYVSAFFRVDEGVDLKIAFEQFLECVELFPFHFIVHLRECIQIIAFAHPDERIRKNFLYGEQKLAKIMASRPVTKTSLLKRYS